MNRITILSLCLLTCTTAFTNAQPSESFKSSEYTFRLARIVLKDGIAKEGWFLGTVRDSMVLQVGTKSFRYSRHDLLRVDIDARRAISKPVLVGMLAGAYLGTTLFMRAENQPALFFGSENNETFEILLLEAAFVLVGGGVGYLAGASQNEDITFDFAGDDAENASTWEELCDSGPASRRTSTVHISMQGSWVSGPFPQSEGNFYYGYYPGYSYNEATRLNLMRRLQLTYSFSDFLEVGLAAMWLGQPPLSRYTSTPYTAQSSSVLLEMSGRGYYAVGVIHPLWKLGWRDVQWDIGAGVGLATIDLQTTSQIYTYPAQPSILIGKKGSIFSATVSTELKVFIAEYFSVGIAADLVFIPEDVPDVPAFKFESKTLGTQSVGFVLGFHF